jgi:hypothetical protein
MKKLLLLPRTCLVLLLALYATSQAGATVTVNSTNFPDANFRAAVAQAAGVSENGGTFAESSLTSLDVSGRSITNLKGLELLTGLTYLNVSDNSTLATGANITGLTSLTRLEARNCNLRTLAGTYETYNSVRYAGLIVGTGNSGLRYLDLSHNDRFFTSGNLQYLSGLETLLLNDCAHYDYWGYLPGLGMTSLKYVDVSNCPAMNRIYLRGATQLKHLDAEGTLVQGFTTSPSSSETSPNYIVLSANSPVEYINLTNCAVTNAGLDGITTYGVASLDTLILQGNSSFGYSSAFAHMPSLSYLDISHCNIYFRKGDASTHYLLYYLTPDNNPNLETLLVNNSQMGSHTEGITGFSNLKTVNAAGNPGITHFGVSGSPLLQTLNITSDTNITELKLNDDALPRNDFSLIGVTDNTPIPVQSLYLNGNNYNSISHATGAYPYFSSTLAYLYLEKNTGFPSGAYTLSPTECGGLTGIDLGNNGFTSFHAPSLPSTLTALMLGNTPEMERLEMHNNPGIITMTADTVMHDGSGLYLLGNSALTYMDISGNAEQPNYFQRIGNNFSLENVPIDTLKASHNQFYTFRNLTTVSTMDGWEVWKDNQYGWKDYDKNYNPASEGYIYGFWPASPAQPDSASLEQLTGLQYLDLSYCHLKDSVHLHKNRELLYLDLSHNRVINRYYERRTPDKGAAYRAYVDPDNTIDKRSFPDYKIYIWLKNEGSTGLEEFTGDYNDTIGLYDLDLAYNDKLEYLDISYTGIEQTAARHCYVANARYIWIQDLPNLKYFYADYNGMRSLGVTTMHGRFHKDALKSLERLSAIGMRGSDNKTMQGSINYKTIDPNIDSSPSPLVNLHYINFSYSSYDSIGIKNEKVDTLIIRGNPIHKLNLQSLPRITYVDARECAFKMRGFDPETGRTYPPNVNRYKNGARLGGGYVDTCTNVFPNPTAVNNRITSPFSGLREVRAYDRPELTTLLLDSCNALTEVYAHDNPKLPKIHGFEHLAYPKPEVDAQFHYPPDVDSLRLVWVNDNIVFNELNLTENDSLLYLHAYNDHALGDALGSNGMNLTNNVILKTAWVSNSNLRGFTNGAGEHLDTLYIWDNHKLTNIPVNNNTGLKYFDLRNCKVRNLNIAPCVELIEFDCSNDSIKGDSIADAWGTLIPVNVPTDLDTDGKNTIADLHFKSHSLEIVKADNNDLFCIDGLNNNPSLHTLTYDFNHVNAIDLTGSNPSVYSCKHNGRGIFYGEMSEWKEKDPVTNEAVTARLYYLQLDSLARDGLNNNDTFLGHKYGQDTIMSVTANRRLCDDGFIVARVDTFMVNSSGPHVGNKVVNSAPRRVVEYGSDSQPNPDKIIGTVAFLDKYEANFPEGHENKYYIEYDYLDGRTPTSTSTYYLVWQATGTPTEVEEALEDDLAEPTIVSERYYDISGVEHSEPIKGINIIVRQMSDGSQQTVKVMK